MHMACSKANKQASLPACWLIGQTGKETKLATEPILEADMQHCKE